MTHLCLFHIDSETESDLRESFQFVIYSSLVFLGDEQGKAVWKTKF